MPCLADGSFLIAAKPGSLARASCCLDRAGYALIILGGEFHKSRSIPGRRTQ
jgi:hypothetical protein